MDGAALRDDAMAGGDRARDAFGRLWTAYRPRLCVFAASYRGLPVADRDDAVAESLIAAFGALEGYDARRPLSPWVYRIAANRFSDAARRSGRVSILALGPEEGAWDPPAAGDHAADAADRDLSERCRAALRRLPDADRRIAQLRFLEGMDSREVGAALGMPAATVRSRVARIRAAVRAAVGEDSP